MCEVRFFSGKYEEHAVSFQFNFTSSPSNIVGYDLENTQFFHAYMRTRGLLNSAYIEVIECALQDVIALDKQCGELPSKFGPEHYVKLRQIYIDDKNGNYTLYVDYLHDNLVPPHFSESDIQLILGHGMVKHHGQCQWVEVSIKTASFSSDYFWSVADEYYENRSE
jgi:hypothetical protein